MLKTIALFVAATAAAFAEGSDKEQAQIWNLEKRWDPCGYPRYRRRYSGSLGSKGAR